MKQNKPGAVIIEGHIQGLSNARSLGEAGIPVYVVDKSDCIAHYSRYCKKFFRCPDYNSDDFAVFLINLAKNESLKDWLLLPSNDHAVFTLSKNRTKLEEHYKIITSSPEVIQNIYDKSKLLKVANETNVPIPKTFYFSSVDEILSQNLPFPVITKGCNGLSFYKSMDRKAFLSYNKKELTEHLNIVTKKIPVSSTFTQEVIPSDGNNKTISFTAFCIEGIIKTYWIGEKLREHPWQFGTATFCISKYYPELVEPSSRILRYLNYTGICEIEYLKDPRKSTYLLIEINARTWLWVGLAKECGIDYAKIIYSYANQKSLVYPDHYTIDLKWINRLTDTLVVSRALLSRKLTLSEYFKSLKGKKVFAVFTWKDIWVSLLFPFFALFLIKKRKFVN